MVGAGLRRVVRRARLVRRVLGERLVGVERQVAVDLAGRDVVEALDARSASPPRSSVCVPITFVWKKRPGSTTASELCDSAAKLTITSISSSRSVFSASSKSAMSPWTKTIRSSRSARLSRFPAYVSRSYATTWSSGCCSTQWRTKFEPMKPAAPVTRILTRQIMRSDGRSVKKAGISQVRALPSDPGCGRPPWPVRVLQAQAKADGQQSRSSLSRRTGAHFCECPGPARLDTARRDRSARRSGGPRAAAADRLRQRPRLGPRRRARAVRCVRLRAARLELGQDRRPLLPGDDARRRAGQEGARAARRWREARGDLVALGVHGRRRRGQEPQAHGRRAANRAGAEGAAVRGQRIEGTPRPARVRAREPTALARGPRLSRVAARPGRRLRSPDRERRRARVVPSRRRRVGDARPLAGRGARRAGRRRSHLRACPEEDIGHLRPLQRHAQPGLRRNRGRVDRAPWPRSRRPRARWSSTTTSLL